jgi:uncharacterized membrane protein YdfJ with MMPL/SSD domain
MNWDDALRIVLILGFAVLAVLLPTAIRVHARDERRTDARLLAWTVWAIFAAGVLAILHRIGQPIRWDVTGLRILVLALGFTYVARNLRRRRRGLGHGSVGESQGHTNVGEPVKVHTTLAQVVAEGRASGVIEYGDTEPHQRPCPACGDPIGMHAPDGARPTGAKACAREGCECAFTRDQLEDPR